MSEQVSEQVGVVGDGGVRSSLATSAARNLATTTKSVPQMRGITSRWLSRVLPWVETRGGVYRVNRRVSYTVGDGRVTFVTTGAQVRVIPDELRKLAPLRELSDRAVLGALADRFRQDEYQPGETITTAGAVRDRVVLLAHGKANVLTAAEYGDEVVVRTLADGDHLGGDMLLSADGRWPHTVRAATPCTVLTLPRPAYTAVLDSSEVLRGHVERVLSARGPAVNRYGEVAVEVASGHVGEPALAGTFVDYEESPREYELSVAQTVLRVHTRVADLYNDPMDQVEQQLRLTVEALRERQEQELVTNREFGLLHNADLSQRIPTRTGPPTPDDLDELLTRRRKTRYLLAHPWAVAAFRRECNRRGIHPDSVTVEGHRLTAWRGVPLLPCDKIPVSEHRTTSILAMRTGEEDEGVVGLHQTGLPDEYQPGLSVRFMGVDDRAVISYLVSTYYSAAVLVPDALGILEHVELGH